MPRKAAARVIRCLSPVFGRKSNRAAVVFMLILCTELFRTASGFQASYPFRMAGVAVRNG